MMSRPGNSRCNAVTTAPTASPPNPWRQKRVPNQYPTSSILAAPSGADDADQLLLLPHAEEPLDAVNPAADQRLGIGEREGLSAGNGWRR